MTIKIIEYRPTIIGMSSFGFQPHFLNWNLNYNLQYPIPNEKMNPLQRFIQTMNDITQKSFIIYTESKEKEENKELRRKEIKEMQKLTLQRIRFFEHQSNHSKIIIMRKKNEIIAYTGSHNCTASNRCKYFDFSGRLVQEDAKKALKVLLILKKQSTEI